MAVVPRTAIVPDTGVGSLSQLRPFHSLPPNDGVSDDTDSSLIDYQRGKHTTSCVDFHFLVHRCACVCVCMLACTRACVLAHVVHLEKFRTFLSVLLFLWCLSFISSEFSRLCSDTVVFALFLC